MKTRETVGWGLALTTALCFAFYQNTGLRCEIQEGDKVFNSATQKHGTVRHLDGKTCRVGVMYNDNSVSQQFSENGGISYTVDYWTLNKTR